MVTDKQRKLIIFMIKIGAFKTGVSLRNVWIDARSGFNWLLERIKRSQVVDDHHHAPACPANHFHKQRLVFQSCSCGAEAYERSKK